MSTRKPTLDEWFLAHQLRALGRTHFYTPTTLSVDVTPITERWAARGERLSFPALVMKALALTARDVPEINRCYMSTLRGDRITDFDEISVNMPIRIHADDGRPFLIAHTVRKADTLTVGEIQKQIGEAQKRRIEDTRIVKILAKKPNTLVWRTALRALHFAAYEIPGSMEKLGAGGLSVSSIQTHGEHTSDFRAVSFGPTAVTVLINRVREDGARKILELSLGFDHVAVSGVVMRRAADALRDRLEASDDAALRDFE